MDRDWKEHNEALDNPGMILKLPSSAGKELEVRMHNRFGSTTGLPPSMQGAKYMLGLLADWNDTAFAAPFRAVNMMREK